jgi:hypothetical protein
MLPASRKTYRCSVGLVVATLLVAFGLQPARADCVHPSAELSQQSLSFSPARSARRRIAHPVSSRG